MSRRILRPKKQTLCMRNCEYENAYRITIPKQLVLENHNHNFGTNIYINVDKYINIIKYIYLETEGKKIANPSNWC